MSSDPTNPADDGDEPESRRAVARRARRDAGEASARMSSELMQIPESALLKLELDEDLLDAVKSARKITSHTARRRAERALAGELRRIDLDELTAKLTSVRTTGVVDTRRLHAAERWRTRLLEDPGAPAAFHTAHPASDPAVLARLIADAHRERATGKPPGAGRALFRHITGLIAGAATTGG